MDSSGNGWGKEAGSCELGDETSVPVKRWEYLNSWVTTGVSSMALTLAGSLVQSVSCRSRNLNFWRQNYVFFLILAHTVYKM